MLNLARLLLAAVAFTGCCRDAAAQIPEGLSGDPVSISVSGTFPNTYQVTVPFSQTIGGQNTADPKISLDESGNLKLLFPSGIGSTTDFNIFDGIELVLTAPDTYFGLDTNGNIVYDSNPIVENGTPDVNGVPGVISQVPAIAQIEYNECVAAANAHIPVASLVDSQIFINIPTGASAPAFCGISYTWSINAIVTDTNCPTPNFPGCVNGDPQFTGFLGQSYQVHGVSGQVYNILSTPSFSYNALFTYLDQGKCRKGTPCFSHPGNYFGQVGLLFRSVDGAVSQVQVIAGPVDTGLQVLVNGASINVSSSSIPLADSSITFSNPFELVVDSPEFSMKLANSDMFINQDVAINTSLMKRIQEFRQAVKSESESTIAVLASKLPHGLLGQTWQRKTYNNRWKHIEGTLFEYSVSDGVTGTEFKYNRF